MELEPLGEVAPEAGLMLLIRVVLLFLSIVSIVSVSYFDWHRRMFHVSCVPLVSLVFGWQRSESMQASLRRSVLKQHTFTLAHLSCRISNRILWSISRFCFVLVVKGSVVAAVALGDRATALNHEGFVTTGFDGDSKTWFLCHGLTHEMVTLSDITDRHYEIAFDEHGFGCIVGTLEDGDDSDADVRDVDDVLTKQCFRSTNGQILIETSTASEGGLQWLADLDAAHTFNAVSMSGFGTLRSTILVNVASFDRRRTDGCRLMWSLVNLMEVLSLHPDPPNGQDTKGEASRKYGWLRKRFATWEQWMHARPHAGTLSRQSQTKHAVTKEGHDRSRTLPWMAASTCAVLAIVARSLSGGLGGFNVDDRRYAAARQFLKYLFHQVCRQPFELQLRFETDSMCRRWPMPPVGCTATTIMVEDGFFAFPDCPASNRIQPYRDAADFFRVRPGDRVELYGFFIGCVAESEAMKHIGGQLMRALGGRIEDALFATVANDTSPQEDMVLAEPDGSSLLLKSDLRVETKIMSHLEDCRRACSGSLLHLSFVGDRSRVGNLGVQDFIGALPSNIGLLGPPTVACIYL
jgi:hypothetical protein